MNKQKCISWSKDDQWLVQIYITRPLCVNGSIGNAMNGLHAIFVIGYFQKVTSSDGELFVVDMWWWCSVIKPLTTTYIFHSVSVMNVCECQNLIHSALRLWLYNPYHVVVCMDSWHLHLIPVKMKSMLFNIGCNQQGTLAERTNGCW